MLLYFTTQIGDFFSFIIVIGLLACLFLSSSILLGIQNTPVSFSYFLTSPRIRHSSQRLWFVLLQNGIRSQNLVSRSVHCSGISQLAEQKNVNVHTNLCVYMHINKY